jgi:hypothetical protein
MAGEPLVLWKDYPLRPNKGLGIPVRGGSGVKRAIHLKLQGVEPGGHWDKNRLLV